MDLSPPRPKRRCKLNKSDPLPVIQMKSGKIYKFQGIFDGFSVMVKDANDMKKIVSMGYFGKASLSRSFPQFDGSSEKPEIIRKRQYERRRKWSDKFEMKNIRKIIVLPDSDDEKDYFTNLQASYEIDKCGNKENLNLMLEEAFFMENALGCLDIFFENKMLSHSELWKLFTTSDPWFPSKYIAYYHFRSKNWVVKPGIKFGGDFLLYKDGPPFYHASYVTVIQNIDSEEHNEIDTTSFMGLHRMCETAGKELLICQLFTSNEQIRLENIPQIKLKEILMKRWVSSQERQEN